ncbi:hypothetical protein CR155_15560 [Pollutimonas nitritireducens]|uniref:Uncharacterized protein n=1 Tax=Pollutimonas nitritireducens TaxID=2045209 RepID=A0A2N4UCV9_9BURK|nr:hypothetical protein [Pollutimonas nitritireducens]PLC52827.1 hypothetical protein CR155_15560 [Pollutimonas nitritireducens]
MASEPRNDWESAVYDLLSEQGDMTWSDAQAMIEAQELQGNDVLASAWNDGLTLSQTVKLLLKMSE